MTHTRDQILEYVLHVLEELRSDWDFSVPLGPDVYLVGDLAFESLDLVVLGTSIQEHYQRQIPFAEFLAEIGQRQKPDATVAELVDFVATHLALDDSSIEPVRKLQ